MISMRPDHADTGESPHSNRRQRRSRSRWVSAALIERGDQGTQATNGRSLRVSRGSRTSRRLLIVIGALLPVSGGCASDDSSHRTAATPNAIDAVEIAATAPDPAENIAVTQLDWHECEEPSLSIGRCATLTVPLDYQDPHGATVDLFVFGIPARAGPRGVLFTNPGGPGASGVDSLADWHDALPPEFDLVTFDPRGVGRSMPLDCITTHDLDDLYTSLIGNPSDADIHRELTTAARIADTCTNTTIGAHMGTTDVARDLEQLRRALGEPQLSYLGFSYGTVLGWTYAGMFPDHVRAMVLDGPVDPEASIIDGYLTQAETIADVLDDFAAWCATDPVAVCPDDPHTAVSEILHTATASPTPTRPGRPPLSPFYVLNALLSGFYTHQLWPNLGAALLAAANGDALALAQLSTLWTQRTTIADVGNLAAPDVVFCADHTERPSVEELAAAGPAIDEAAPAFAPFLRVVVPRCYGHPPATQPVPPPAPTTSPVLVVAATGDIATPYQGARNLARALEATLVTRDGDGHISYGFNACINRIVDAYLLDPSTPPTANRCSD